MTQANHKPAHRITAEERRAINKSLFETLFRKGLNGADRAVKSGNLPSEIKDKDGKSKPVDKEKVSTFIKQLMERQKEFREKCDKLRKEGIRRRRDIYKQNPEKEPDAKVEETKVDETPVEETKVAEQPTSTEK